MKNVEFFDTHGYCVVKNVLSNELRDFITQYALFDAMQNYNGNVGDGQSSNAHFKYADPAMETMLVILQNIMEENTGLELFPTYSYHRVYQPGSELPTHTDRPACEISCTLCINYEYEDTNYSWPIFVDGNKIELKPGDLVIYKGFEKPHWRNKFIGGNRDWHLQGFFHYVNKNGPFSEWKYDKRNSIGEKKNSLKPYIKLT